MRTLLLTALIAYVWYAYAEPFSLFLYHHAARENALTLYRDGPAIFAGLLFAGLIVVSMMLKAISHRHRAADLYFVRVADLFPCVLYLISSSSNTVPTVTEKGFWQGRHL